MKREELIAYDKWLTRRKWGTGEIISPEKAADLYLAEHPLPPAEGATAEEFLKGCEHDGSFIPVHEVIRLMNAFAASQKQQPTAEGAEEIDDETIAYAAEYQCGTPFSERWIGFVKGAKWHRSLHAQKIADKMVEDMRQKLFSMRATKKTMDMLSEADRLITYGYHDCINEMLMWTKSRDSHE
jgi:hypothetical protein